MEWIGTGHRDPVHGEYVWHLGPHMTYDKGVLEMSPEEFMAYLISEDDSECALCEVYGPPNEDGFHVTASGRSARLCQALRDDDGE